MTSDQLLDLLSVHPDAEVIVVTKDGCYEVITASGRDASYTGKIVLLTGAYVPADWEGPKGETQVR